MVRETKTDEFDEVKKSRNTKLNDFIAKFKAILPEIYGVLTSKSGDASSGGKANIIRTDERFDVPILLDFCPPGKTWGPDVSSLSGGEQAIATLAFIFALVKIMKPPLLVMDEVDQFLDPENTGNVTNYLRRILR